MSQYLFLLLFLACPLMMVFMMRGMHGGRGGSADGGHAHTMGGCHGGHDHSSSDQSLEELRTQREQLDRQIEEREAEEQTPVGGGWR
jgi:Spy/CpxP family protein refolding chaperone